MACYVHSIYCTYVAIDYKLVTTIKSETGHKLYSWVVNTRSAPCCSDRQGQCLQTACEGGWQLSDIYGGLVQVSLVPMQVPAQFFSIEMQVGGPGTRLCNNVLQSNLCYNRTVHVCATIIIISGVVLKEHFS